MVSVASPAAGSGDAANTANGCCCFFAGWRLADVLALAFSGMTKVGGSWQLGGSNQEARSAKAYGSSRL